VLADDCRRYSDRQINEERVMDNQSELQRLLQRQHEIRQAMRRPGGIRITVERELYAIHEQLKKFPAALRSLPNSAADDPAGR
jgi:hypothetical protein